MAEYCNCQIKSWEHKNPKGPVKFKLEKGVGNPPALTIKCWPPRDDRAPKIPDVMFQQGSYVTIGYEEEEPYTNEYGTFRQFMISRTPEFMYEIWDWDGPEVEIQPSVPLSTADTGFQEAQELFERQDSREAPPRPEIPSDSHTEPLRDDFRRSKEEMRWTECLSMAAVAISRTKEWDLHAVTEIAEWFEEQIVGKNQAVLLRQARKMND